MYLCTLNLYILNMEKNINSLLLKWLQTENQEFIIRKEIPILANKSETATINDKYENFWEMVTRFTVSAYSDILFEEKGFNAIYEWVKENIIKYKLLAENNLILEAGCGAGRLLYDLADGKTNTHFIGLDYSYNMLKRCKELVIDGEMVRIDWRHKGYDKKFIQGKKLKNVSLLQADACQMPFINTIFDGLISSFVIDRVSTPSLFLKESNRILKAGGILFLISPLNFQEKELWAEYGSAEKLAKIIKESGFEILEYDKLIAEEPLDAAGNAVVWKSNAWVLRKLGLPIK